MVSQPTDVILKRTSSKITAEPGERAVVARISTAAVDRDGDVVVPRGMDAKDYNKNPVVMFGHGSHPIPIGQATEIQRDSSGITAKVVFAERPEELPPTAEWLADTILSLFKQNVLRAFSIGFKIKESREASEKDVRKFGEGVYRIITKWELLEFSVVPVPANQEALATAVSKGVVGENEVTKLWNIQAEQRCLDLPIKEPLTLIPEGNPTRELDLSA